MALIMPTNHSDSKMAFQYSNFKCNNRINESHRRLCHRVVGGGQVSRFGGQDVDMPIKNRNPLSP